MRALALALDQDSERQASQAERGMVAPDFVLDLALTQMNALRSPDAMDNRLTRSIVRRSAGTVPGDWGPRCATIIRSHVYPALDRQIALLQRLRATGRTLAGVGGLRDGAALYDAALQSATTVAISAAEIERTGLTQIANICAQLDPLLVAQGLTRGPVGVRLLELSQRPELRYADTPAGREELLVAARARTDAMRSRLAAVFGDLPTTPLRIEAAAAEVEDGASDGNYFRASLDGSVPARVRLNLKTLTGSPRYALPALVYHEGSPGHHLQYSYARGGQGGRYTAYSEGWALYAERLADELGAYATPLERIGYLAGRLLRAVRLVIDTGIHVHGWSRERAIDYLVTQTGCSAQSALREVNRYCAEPGQACAYMIGYLAWIDARDTARRMMGRRYDAKRFRAVLLKGAVPLPILQRLVAEQAQIKR